MPATAPMLAEPEQTLRFGDGDGGEPPKILCKLLVFPKLRETHWLSQFVIPVARYRAVNNLKRGSTKKGRDASIEFLDDVLKERADELKGLGLDKTQIQRELDSIRAAFYTWIARELPNG